MGTLFIDDVSASILPASAFRMIESDFNGDGAVDGLDLDVWKRGFGASFDGSDFLAWQRDLAPVHSGSGRLASIGHSAVPEPGAALLACAALASCRPLRARSHERGANAMNGRNGPLGSPNTQDSRHSLIIYAAAALFCLCASARLSNRGEISMMSSYSMQAPRKRPELRKRPSHNDFRHALSPRSRKSSEISGLPSQVGKGMT